jgi:hypothetical protein
MRFICRAVLFLAAFLASWTVTHATAAEPAASNRSARWLDPLQYYDLLRQGLHVEKPPEIVEMITAIASGSQMGQGDGWFHGSQGRYGWKWLAARFDANHDGTITRQEFFGPQELFDRLDRNHDGVLTPSDFDWSQRSSFAMQSAPSRYWFAAYDQDSNGRITREEWDALFARAAGSKGYLTADDLREAFPVAPPPRRLDQPPPPPQANQGPAMFTLFKGLLSGELGSAFEGPAINQRAPDFELKTQDGSRAIRLSSFRGKKPVVLVFGSFT